MIAESNKRCDKVLVDLHMLIHDGTYGEWFHQAVESALDQPVMLHILHNKRDSIGAGRAKGFGLGICKYVGCIDPDDWLLPEAVERCVAALDADPQAVGAFTDELRADDKDKIIGHGNSTGTGAWDKARQLTQVSYGRHLAIMRRELVTPYLDNIGKIERLSEYVLRGLLVKHGHWIHVEHDGYVHREHANNAGKSTTPEQIMQAIKRVAPVLYPKVTKERERFLSAAQRAYWTRTYGCCG